MHTYYRTHTLILGDRGETECSGNQERGRQRDYILYIWHSQSHLSLFNNSVKPWDATLLALLKNGETVSVWWSMPLTSLTFHFVSQNPHFLVVWVLLTASFSQKHCLFIQFQHEFCINKNQNLPVFHVLLHVKQKSISLSYLPVRPFGYFFYSYCSFSRWDRKSWRQIT